VTNNLGGANRIYQFSADLGGAVISISEPTGFEDTGDGDAWTDDYYSSAIAPGETGYFSALNFAGPILPPSIGWSVSVEGGPNGEATEFFEGAVETIPEPSTWAMMLLGFAGLGYAGYRRQKLVGRAIV
jgi:hypothetical protein